MEPSSAVPPWNPDDDFLLKNAIEAGASLESLARGAVTFSRPYSYRELRERWGSILYDPVVADEASASLANMELKKSNGGGGINEEVYARIDAYRKRVDAYQKRKPEAIRKQYYAMRRKLRDEVIFNSLDIALRDEMCLENPRRGKQIRIPGLSTNGKLNKIVNNSALVNDIINYGKKMRLVETVADSSSHSMSEDPIWRTLEDVSAPDMSVHVDIENKNGVFESTDMIAHVLKDKCGTDNGLLSDPDVAVNANVETHISDAMLNLPNGDELMFVNTGEKDEIAKDKPRYDNVNSLLLCSPCYIPGNDETRVHESQKFVAETQLALSTRSSAELEAVANSAGSSHGESDFVPDCGNELQSSAVAQSSYRKFIDEFRFCSINTEDPNIPSNNIDLVKVCSVVPTVTPKPISIVKEVGYPDSPISNQRRNEPDGSVKKEDIPSNSFAASQTVRPGSVPNINLIKENPVAAELKTESPAKTSITAIPRQSRLVHATMKHAADGHPKKEVVIALPSPFNTHLKVEEHKTLPDLEEKLLCIDQERDDVDGGESDLEDGDDESEIPYYSDVEAMILEMDLGPTDKDPKASAEVLRYHNEKDKRTIIRMEQCAQASVHRTIASRGAFAALYGRTMKEFINKPQVVLGRATEGMEVDIDLSQEGQANKISRRQAIIKRVEDGSFVIKNLGKCPIFLNGKKVTCGQLRGLSAGSLIEIRDLAFIFEVTNRHVERRIEGVREHDVDEEGVGEQGES